MKNRQSKTKLIKTGCLLLIEPDFFNYRNMHMYCCKNCKKHTGKTFPKKLVLISNNKIE